MSDDLSWREIEIHPAADAFPMISEDELLELAQDIQQKGLFHPIMLSHDGTQLVDGRNRRRACKMAGVEPRYECLPEGVDPIDYVVSANIARRDITKGQKALALALIYPEPERGGRGNTRKNGSETLQFSKARLSQARQIIRHLDLVDLVKSGAMKFDMALEEAQARNRVKENSDYYFAQLRDHAPDIAERVADEHLNLQEGWTLYEKRKAEVAELERSQCEGLLRNGEALYYAATGFANDDFAAQLERRMADSGFRAKFYERLRGEDWKAVERGLSRFLGIIEGAPK